MIQGYYATRPDPYPSAPYVRAFIVLRGGTRLGRNIDFLIDTGADDTCLHPSDVIALGVDASILNPNTRVSHTGIGGGLYYYSTEATLVFEGAGDWVVWTTHISVCDIWTAQLDPRVHQLPSLIGRDFLNLCDVRADASKDIVLMNPYPQRGLAVTKK